MAGTRPRQREARSRPAGVLVQTVTFEEVGGQARLTVRTRFASAAIRDARVKMGMRDGWAQSLDRLAALTTG